MIHLHEEAPAYLTPLLYLASAAALLPQPGVSRFLVPLPLIFWAGVGLLSYYGTSPVEAYFRGCYVGQIWLIFLDQHLLSKPETDFYLIDDSAPDRGEPKADAPPAHLQTWYAKLWWSLQILSSQRGGGWSWQVKNVPRGVPSTYPRW